MQKKWAIALLALIVVFAGTLLVYAGIHFGGATSFGYGSLIANIQVVEVSASSGVNISVVATGSNLTANCVNKAGRQPPAHNPVTITVSASASQTVTSDSAGNALASFELNLIPSSAKAAGCPSNQWSVTDLFGTLNVVLTARDNATGDVASENLVCSVSQQNREVTCQ